jgi:DNA primase catalytic core
MSTPTFQDVLLRVKEGADIVAVVGQYVPLRRAGSRYVGMCPFHNDRHPSMNVNPRMGIYKCFACGAGGDAIKFVQEFEKIGFIEALKQVAAKAGIAIPENFAAGNKDDGDRVALVLQANQLALQAYTEAIEKTPHWVKYLEERGLKRETVKHFQIGCAPEQPDRIRQLAEAKKVPGKAFVEAGILGVAAGGRIYDRFGGRLVFPIFNLSGRVIAFGGRIAPGREGPKYVNTPESPLYHKGRVLYGFNFGRQAIDQSGEAVVVEGYMDLVSLWQAGVTNVVAVCGTALTKEHAQMLTRFAKKVHLFFDGDAAGRTAVRRSLEPLLAQGVEVRVPVLPASEDPDSYVRTHSLEELRGLFDAADDLPGFLIRAAGDGKLLRPEEKEAIVNEAATLLAGHPSQAVRMEHLDILRKHFGLRFGNITPTAPSSRTKNPTTKLLPQDDRLGLFVPGSPVAVRSEDKPEWQYLQLLISYPDQCVQAAEKLNLDWFMDDRVRELADYALALLAEGRGLSLVEFRDRVPDSLRDALDALDTAEGEDPERVLRRLADHQDALEMRHLKRLKAAARDLAETLEIQKRIKALESRRL